MLIEIVNYESGLRVGILTKYANKMNEGLLKIGEKSFITSTPTGTADITHHINYWPYRHENSPNSVNTLMITHIDSDSKERIVRKGLETAHGICFSQEVADRFTGTSVILPAHDGIEKPKTVYIPTNVYEDGCKREGMFYELLKVVPPEFRFIVMGTGWDTSKFTDAVQYLATFNYQDHLNILQQAQYALYFGRDEGAMGMLDATNCGLITIAPLAGFHKEMGIDYPFDTQEELNAIFTKLGENRVKEWTWEHYCKQHLNLWQKLR